jgi:WYL_2, Sm-like SH3 beta-barrel fold
MTPDQAATAIRKSAGRPFGCTFIKADGSVREMWCRYAEVQPVKQHRNHAGVITVWDDLANGWRSIPISRLTHVRIDGQNEEVK